MKGMLRLTEEKLKEIEARHKPRVVHVLEGDEPKRQLGQAGSKYKNKRFQDEDGNWWDSIKEYRRWKDLRLLESAGKIGELRKKVPFDLLPAKFDESGKRRRPVRYVADFVYVEDGVRIIEDAKGYRNKLYELKKRLMWQLLGIEIFET